MRGAAGGGTSVLVLFMFLFLMGCHESMDGYGAAAPQTNASGKAIISCCWAGLPQTCYGNFSWSQDPASGQDWDKDWNNPLDASGCAEGQVDLTRVTVGIWCDVTRVPAEQAGAMDWLADRSPPVSAYVNGTPLRIRYFEFGRGWRVGNYGGDDPGCNDGVGYCQAP